MHRVRRWLRWLLTLLLLVLLASSALRGAWLAGALLVLACIAVIPLAEPLRHGQLGWLLHPVTRLALVLAALLAFVGILRVSAPDSIYASAAVRDRLLQIYDEQMRDWPVPYEDRYVETAYGRVHVLVSGGEDRPPLLLLHASGVSSWSWKYNIAGLSRSYRVYAIDQIGDAGKSAYRSLNHVVDSGQAEADLYAGIADALGVSSAYVAGASEGGFIATNLALHHPERVRKLALIAPMGYSGAVGAIARITLTQLFPLRSLQEGTFAWAFSSNPALQKTFGEWFRLVMGDTTPVKVAPLPFSAEERQSLRMPVLFILGERDRLVGDPRQAAARVQDVPDVTVVVLDAGHLVAAEKPDRTNALLRGFFKP